MYFEYITNWFYRLMKIPFPLVLSDKVYGLVTAFDIFLFTVFMGVFIILIKYLITDSLSFDLGNTDINYSSSAYLPKRLRSLKQKTNDKKESANNANND